MEIEQRFLELKKFIQRRRGLDCVTVEQFHDDFIQDHILKLIEGKNTKQSYIQAFFDHLRKIYGVRKKFTRMRKWFWADDVCEDISAFPQYGDIQVFIANDFIEHDLQNMYPKLREAMELLIYGYDFKTIAKKVGWSEKSCKVILQKHVRDNYKK